MKFFLYEYITGGGLLAESLPPRGSLLAEGSAMISALAEDFARLGDVSVMLDDRIDFLFAREVKVFRVAYSHDEQSTFERLAVEADWTLVVAPEFGAILSERTAAARTSCKNLLNCSQHSIQIASDKQQTAELLASLDVPVPCGRAVQAGEEWPRDFPYPAVVKPIDGAGSQEVQYVATQEELSVTNVTNRSLRIEQYCPGMPASCAVLCGPAHSIALKACSQQLADAPSFAYLGGGVPVDAHLDRRAKELARRAVAALPEPLGYVGVDLALGPEPDGRDDVVIEINPRLTTSYVGLRQLATTNLAAAMLEVARGSEPAISWRDGHVDFLADGTILHPHSISY
jgi:predicted ATP-grasp superfamily ATP-dependent carboligase